MQASAALGARMFIDRQQHPTIEFDPAAGQEEPTVSHFFSDQVDPFKTDCRYW